jgi:ABC-type glycerol-3-phosphate transport system substrate-binding protein
MDELMEAAKQITEKSNGEIYGITLRGQQGIHAVYIWATFLWGFGGRWLDENGRADLYTPEAIAGTQFYADILNKYGPPGYANFGWMENRVAFTSGKAAISIDATVNGAFNEDPNESSVVGKVGYAPVPQAAGVKLQGGQHSLAVHHLYLSKYSKNKEAAFLFMSWATSGPTQTKGLELEPNSGATSKMAMNSSVYQEKFGAFRDGMLEALSKANTGYLPEIPEANEMFNRVGVALSQVLAGKKSAEDALKDVNEELNTQVLKKK